MKQLLDDVMIHRSIKRMSHEILEHNKGADNIILVGIKTRGVPLAHRIARQLWDIEQIKVEVIEFDISQWRDDDKKQDGMMNQAVQIDGKDCILVDDVLYSGRTVRAAMDGLMHHGRPKRIQLAVLVDRGHRELPIRADYVGKNLPTSQRERIQVSLSEIDGVDQVVLDIASESIF